MAKTGDEEPVGPNWIDQIEAEKRAKAATERAIAGASRPRSQENEAVRYKYAQQALERESELLASLSKGSRNNQLNVSAMKLAQLVASGYLDQEDVDRALEDACYTNGYIQEKGIKKFRASLRSGTEFGLSEPRDLAEVGLKGIQNYTAVAAEPTPDLDHLLEIEGDFWESRQSLQDIYVGALAGMAAPWAVLGCCAAKALALAPPNVELPALIGGKGSLNWFCALASASGGGKGAALDVTDTLIRSTVLQKNIGSGEGMIEAYKRPRDKETGEPSGQHESIMFIADEIDTLAAHSSRSGSTVLPMLRSAFSGATLGASTKASNGFHLAARSYRMTLIVGAQPSRASAILDDENGGTPQRFMWFPAIDARITADRPMAPGELTVTNELTSDKWQYGCELVVPEEVERTITRARVKAMRGQGDSLDSHSLYVREKFAYALAILDGRDYMTVNDWRLSGVAMKVSDYTREWVMAGQEAAIQREAEKKGKTIGYTQSAAEDTRSKAVAEANGRIEQWVIKHLKKVGEQGLTNRELTRKASSRDTARLPMVLEQMQRNGMILKSDGKWSLIDEEEPF